MRKHNNSLQSQAIVAYYLNNKLFYSQDIIIVSNSKLKWFNRC